MSVPSTPEELRKLALDTGYAVVGATDLALTRIREAQHNVREAAAKLPEHARNLPSSARAFTRERADEVEAGFGDLSGRGKEVLDRLSSASPASDLIKQGKATVAKGRSAFTGARQSASDASRATVKTTAAPAEPTVTAEPAAAAETASEATPEPKPTRKAASTPRRPAGARSAVKGAATARKTARSTAESTQKAADSAAE